MTHRDGCKGPTPIYHSNLHIFTFSFYQALDRNRNTSNTYSADHIKLDMVAPLAESAETAYSTAVGLETLLFAGISMYEQSLHSTLMIS
jgi:hypothetical protein